MGAGYSTDLVRVDLDVKHESHEAYEQFQSPGHKMPLVLFRCDA